MTHPTAWSMPAKRQMFTQWTQNCSKSCRRWGSSWKRRRHMAATLISQHASYLLRHSHLYFLCLCWHLQHLRPQCRLGSPSQMHQFMTRTVRLCCPASSSKWLVQPSFVPDKNDAAYKEAPWFNRDLDCLPAGIFITASLASSTRNVYSKSAFQLQEFTQTMYPGQSWFPSSVSLICTFITHLLDKVLSSASVYIVEDCFFHKLFHLRDPTSNFLVRRILLGAHKELFHFDSRLPITLPILHTLHNSFRHVTQSHYFSCLVRAMYFPCVPAHRRGH